MKVLRKILLIVVGVAFASTIALAVFLPMYFDPNDYKTQIAEKLKEKTGRDFSIPGDISLSVFPWLGVEIGEASMSNAPGFGKEPFASVKAAEISVALLPLLRKEIQVGSVMLDGLVLRLQKNALGQNNWDDIGEQDKPDDEDDEESEFKLENLEVAALEIKNSSVLWDNVQNASRYQLNDFNFSTGMLRSGDPFDLSSDFILVSGKPEVSRKVAVESEVTADIEKKTYQLEDFELKTEPVNTATGNTQPLSVSGELDLDLAKQTLVIAGLVVETAGLKATGSAQGSQILDAPRFKGQLKSGDINPRAVMKALGKEDPDTSDSSVLKNAKFEAAFEGSPERIDFRPLSMQLDDSRMNGSLSVANFSQPAIGFDLTMDQLDLDRYLSPPDKRDAGVGSGDGKVEEGEVSVDAIKDLNLNGTLKVGKFKVRNLRFSDASLVLRARDGILAIEPLTANFYSGRINMTGRVDANGPRPAYNINAQTSNIKVEPMLVDLNGQSKVTGTGSVNLNVTTAGTGSEEIKRRSNGTMSFNLRDGEFRGVNVGQKLRQAYALYKGERFTANEPETTRFSQIKGSAQINNGVLQNDDLDADSTIFGVAGAGTANLVAETINYLARITIDDNASGELGKGLEGLLGKTIPVRLTGNLYDPDWRLDLAGVVQGKIQEEIDKKKDEAKDKLKEKLDDKLKDLFNRGDDRADAATPVPTPSPSTAAPSTSTSPAAPASEPPPPTEAESKAAKKAEKKARQEQILRELIGAPKEETAPAPAPSEPAPAQ